MGFASDQYSYSFSDGGLQLLIELVDADSVTEVENRILIFLAFEHNCDVKSNEDVIKSWTGANREAVDNVLFRDQKLNLRPRHTHVESSV